MLDTVLDIVCYISALQTPLSKITWFPWKTRVSLADYAKHHNVRLLEINTKPVKLNRNIYTLLTSFQPKPGLKHNWVTERGLVLGAAITTEFNGNSQKLNISSGRFRKVGISQEKISYIERNDSTFLRYGYFSIS